MSHASGGMHNDKWAECGFPAAPDTSGAELSRPAAEGAGLQRALKVLWDRHNLGVFLFARGKLSNREDARDVCQETFVRALAWFSRNGLRSLDDPRYGAWLKKIAANIIIDRHRSPQTRFGTGRGAGGADDGPGPESWVPVSDPLPQPKLDAAAETEAMRRCMERLAAIKRQVVELRGLREQDYGVIEAQLGMTAGAARVTFFRALGELRECIEIRLGRPEITHE